jgi:hypothetical protein
VTLSPEFLPKAPKNIESFSLQEIPVKIELVTIVGPKVKASDLPVNLQKFCPSGFDIFSTRQVPVTKENSKLDSAGKAIIIKDPMVKHGVSPSK